MCPTIPGTLGGTFEVGLCSVAVPANQRACEVQQGMDIDNRPPKKSGGSQPAKSATDDAQMTGGRPPDSGNLLDGEQADASRQRVDDIEVSVCPTQCHFVLLFPLCLRAGFLVSGSLSSSNGLVQSPVGDVGEEPMTSVVMTGPGADDDVVPCCVAGP